MSSETGSTSSTKRPAEPRPGPEVQPRPQTSTNAKRNTLRISAIPIRITKEYLSKILEGLTPLRNETTKGKHHRASNIHSLSLAPSASAFDSDKYQVATVTFKEIPSALAVSNTDTLVAVLEVEGEEIEVNVDMHFRGLTPLNNVSNPSVDIIAVTGLAGHAYGSWRSRISGKMWLQHMIPIDLPCARILTYGYDTKLAGSKSDAQISEYAKQFLETITDARNGDPHRPVIFIGHSLGGLVIKEALILANDDIFRSCYGILFFGVPNRGLENSHLIPMVDGQPNSHLVRDLSRGSQYLTLLHQTFSRKFTFEDYRIISIYETMDTKTVGKILGTEKWDRIGVSVRMVTRESAIHAMAADQNMCYEMSLPADHSTLVKFDSRSDQSYLNVRSHILQLARDAPEVIRRRFSKENTVTIPPQPAYNPASSSCRELTESIQDDERLEVLNWLSDSSFKKHHAFYKSLRSEGTCEWLLEKDSFRSWNESDSSSLLWLHGIAGSGKTTLAIIDDMNPKEKSRECSLAYFYCSYQEDQRKDPASILRSLVKQLCLLSQSGLPAAVLSIYNQRKKDADLSYLLSIEESKHLLIELSSRYLRTTIVVDALDECDANSRGRLCDVLKQVVSLSEQTQQTKQTPIKVFITSRDDGDLRKKFKDSPNVYIQERDNSDDINYYIKTQIKACINAKQLLDGKVNSNLEHRIVGALTTGARGMFIWVKHQITKICSEITQGDVERALSELPEDMDEMYLEMLQGIRKNKSSRASTIAEKALKWILYARRPLSPEEFIEAILFTPTARTSPILIQNQPDVTSLENHLTLSAVFDICQNLVVLDSRLQVLRFAHFSVQEFLLKQFNSEKEHTGVAEVCLDVLVNRTTGSGLPQMLAIMDYVTCNWGDHVRLSGMGSNALRNLCQVFLTPCLAYKTWVLRISTTSKELRPAARNPLAPLLVACFYQLLELLRWLLEMETDPNSANHDGRTSIHLAAINGNHHIVQLLLEKEGIDVDSKDNYGRTPLFWAAESGHEKVVEVLLGKEEVDVNNKGWQGRTPLSQAAENGHEKVVEVLLRKEGVNVNSKDSDDRTPLSRAAENGHEKVVEVLLGKEGVNVNSKDSDDRTPLSRAAGRGHEKVVEVLLGKEGVDVNSKNWLGQTPLSWAAENGHGKVVEVLLGKEGVDVNSKNWLGQTPLSWAAENGHEKVVEMLLKKEGVDVNNKDHLGRTSLSRAAENGHEKVVELLLGKEGIDLNSKDSTYCQTPLSWAASKGHVKVVRMLIRKDDVNLNTTNRDGQTPLRLAVPMNEKVMQMLLEHEGVDLNNMDIRGNTPLIVAALNGYEKVVEALPENERVDVNSKGNNGDTPLILAARNGHEKVVEALLKNERVDVKSKDNSGNTPLIFAALNGYEKVVEALLKDERVDVNSKNDGNTPLILAAQKGHEKVVEVLLKNERVDVNSKDNNGDTPLILAAQEGHEKVVEVLLKNERVDVNSKDNNGDTPLTLAAQEGHGKVVEALLKNERVDVNSKGSGGDTPLILAAWEGYEKVVEALLENERVDVNSKNNNGDTPLILAAREGYEKVVEALLRVEDERVDVNSTNSGGDTPLILAAWKGHEKVVEALLRVKDERVDVNSKNINGSTPLILAASKGHEKVVEALLKDERVDVNSKDNNGHTLLILAAQKGHEKVVEALLENERVDVNSKNINGDTPLALAARQGHEKVVEALLKDERVDVNSKDIYGDTPLVLAAWEGHSEVVQMLRAALDVRVPVVERTVMDGREFVDERI